jgi:DnaK suppressor protein
LSMLRKLIDFFWNLCDFQLLKTSPKKGSRMELTFIDAMEKALLKSKEEIVKNLMAESEDFKALVEDIDPKDLVDVAADDIDRQTLQTLGAQDMKRLRLIDSAISRIKNGAYGKCLRCGSKIPEKRLEAIPYALMCIDCQSADERAHR